MTRVQLPDKSACISLIVNSHGKCMNQTILPLPISKIEGTSGGFNLDIVTGLSERKFRIHTC